jgi:hypothetical protein
MDCVLEVPLDSGGTLLVEADRAELPEGLELATAQPGRMVIRAGESLERSLDRLQPAMAAVSERLRALGPDGFTVEFGLTMAAEAGLVVARGSSEVHFAVTLSWARPGSDG